MITTFDFIRRIRAKAARHGGEFVGQYAKLLAGASARDAQWVGTGPGLEVNPNGGNEMNKPISKQLADAAFAAFLPVLRDMLAGPDGLPEPEEAQARFAAAALPVCKAQGVPEAVAVKLACMFMSAVMDALGIALAQRELAAHGLDARPVAVIPGVGVIMAGTRRPNPNQNAEPSLN